MKTYIKLALRHLAKNRLYLVINSLSLATAITVCWFIINYTQFEKSYDNFYPEVGQLYRVQSRVYQGDELIVNDSRTPVSLFDVIKDEIPGIENACRFFYEDALLFTDRATLSNQAFYWADSTFFQMFDIPFQYGNSQGVLDQVHSMVISEKLSNVLYGDENPMGKTIYLNESLPFQVTGVFKDLPANSNIKFDALATMSTNFVYGWMNPNNNWRNRFIITWVKTENEISGNHLAEGLRAVSDKYLDFREQNNQHTQLYPVNARELHFTQSGLTREVEPTVSKQLLSMLLLVALFVLAIALVNVLNYVVAKTIERLNESGIRKIHGALPRQLILQFSIEALLVLTLSIFVAIGFFYPASKYFSSLLSIPFDSLFVVSRPIVLFTSVLFFSVSALMSIIMVFFINSYRVQDVLKGKVTQSRKEINLRKGLVIFQFAASIVLFLMLVTIYQQINFMRTSDLGIDKESVLIVEAPYSLNSLPQRRSKFSAFEQDMAAQGGVDKTCYSFHIPGEVVQSNSVLISTQAQPDERTLAMAFFRIDYRYFDMFDIRILDGRNFRNDTADSDKLLVNQMAIEALGLNTENVLGQQVRLGNQQFQIIGVVEDFHHNSVQYPIEPALFTTRKPPYWGHFAIKYTGVLNSSVLSKFESIYKKHFPNDPFDYHFIDAMYQEQFQSDIRTGKILGVFSLLVLIIAILGVFGISAYFTNRRMKEIGIRKVLGAHTLSIMYLLNRKIAGWILVSSVIATPIAIYFITRWLDNFAYRIPLPIVSFVITGISVLVFAAATVSVQSYKGAQLNPVKAIRSE